MNANVPTSESGTERLGIRVADGLRRNRKITATTRTTARPSSNSTSATEARIVVVRSVTTATSTAAGSAALSAGSSAWMPVDDGDDVGARLALDVDDDCRIGVDPGGELGVLGAFSACATSESLTGAPFR